MAGKHHQLDGHEFEQVPGVGDGQGSLVCCSLWGLKELDTTEWLNWLTDDLTPRTYLPFNWKFVSFDQHHLNSPIPSPWQPKRFCWEESLQTNFILKLTVIFFFLSCKLKHFCFIFNWRIAILQCCIAFCHTTTQISHNYM